jgi:CHAD domain-containing protein
MYEQVSPEQDMAAYGAKVVETLFRNIAFCVHKTLSSPDEENIHDLRVTCLRLRHCLRLFGRLFPARQARRTLRRLNNLKDMLGAVRSCDIALQTLGSGPIAPAVSAAMRRKITAELEQERRRLLRPLRARLRKLQRSDSLQRWRTRLMPAG